MTYVHINIGGVYKDIARDDAIRLPGGAGPRLYCPTTESTKWVDTWDEAKAAGMEVCWNEDQTEIELRLPAPYKFSIQFQRRGEGQ